MINLILELDPMQLEVGIPAKLLMFTHIHYEEVDIHYNPKLFNNTHAYST